MKYSNLNLKVQTNTIHSLPSNKTIDINLFSLSVNHHVFHFLFLQIEWLKDGFGITLKEKKVYMNRAGSLVINSFSASDQGSYICKASSEVANLMSKEAVLTLAG